MTEFNFDPDQSNSIFSENQKSRRDYEESEDYAKDQQTEAFREKMAPIATKETAKVANDDDSGIVGSTLNFAKHAAIGVAKGVEEMGQTFRMLDDNAFNLPEPKTTAEGLAQGFGQYLPAFIPAAGAIGTGVRLAGLVGKTKKAKMGVDFLIGSAAGAVADVAAFDRYDPNAANFLLVSGAIAQDSAAGAAVKALLAQDDSDTAAVANAKKVADGLIIGSLLTGLFKGAGYAIKKVKGEIVELDGIPIKEVEEAVKKEATIYTDGVLKSKGMDLGDGGPTYNISSEGFKKFGQDLPSIEGAIKDTAERNRDDYVRPWDNLSPEKQKEAGEIVSKWSVSGEVGPVDLKKIESMNFLKIKTSEDLRNVLQFMSEQMDIKRLLKGRIKTEDFDTASGAAKMLDIPEKEMARIIQEQAGNVRGAIKYVGASRALSAAYLKKAEDSFELFVANGNSSHYEEGLSHTKIVYDMLASGGELSKASSDLLRSHKKLIGEVEALSNIKRGLRHTVLYNDPELSIKQSGWFVSNKNVDKIKIIAKFSGSAPKKFKVSRKKGIKSVTERIQSTIKSLTKQLENIKAGVIKSKPEPLPKDAEITSLRKQIKDLQDKDKLPKEQLAARKQFESLSKRIKALQDGQVKDSTGKLKGATKDATVEISQLKAELKKLQAKLKTPTDNSVKRIEQLNKKLNTLLLAKKGDIKPKVTGEKRVKSEKEVELEESIKKQEERLGLIKKDGLTDDELREYVTSQARRSELSDIATATRRQLTTRANAMNKSFKARGRDAMLEIYVNGLLSSAKTFEVNLLGNSTAIITSVIDRAYAGIVKKGGVVTGQEAAELTKSYWKSISSLDDLWSLMKQSWSLEPTKFIKQDFIRPHDRTLSAEGLRVGGNLGHIINTFGSIVNFPGRLLLSADEVFKTINYRAETSALSYRKALSELGVEGSSVQDKVAIKNRFNEIFKNVEEHDDIVEAAQGFMAKNTFTNQLQSHVIKDPITGKDKVVQGLGLRLKGILDSDPTGFSRVFLPFFQTPANLLNFAWERTPILSKLNRGLQADLAKDAPQGVRELAEAKVATSRMLWASTLGLAMSGNFTGGPPTDNNLRKTLEADMNGAHWYSFQLNGKWHKYDRYDPIGVIMGASANLAILAKASVNLAGLQKEEDESGAIREEYMDLIEASTVGMVKLMTERHYLQSFGEMLSVFAGEGSTLGKMQKTGEKYSSVFNPIQALSTGFYSSFRRNVTQGLEPEKLDRMQRTELDNFDDVVTELSTIFEEGLRRVTPGYGSKRAVKNLAGESVLYPGVNYELDRQPFQVLKNLGTMVFVPGPGLNQSQSPLINTLARLQSSSPQPSDVNRINGILLTDEEKGFLIDKWTDKNKLLNSLVKTKNFLNLPEGLQRDLLENHISSNKRKASQLTMAKFERILKGAYDLKRNDLMRKTEDTPKGFNFGNLQGQG